MKLYIVLGVLLLVVAGQGYLLFVHRQMTINQGEVVCISPDGRELRDAFVERPNMSGESVAWKSKTGGVVFSSFLKCTFRMAEGD